MVGWLILAFVIGVMAGCAGTVFAISLVSIGSRADRLRGGS